MKRLLPLSAAFLLAGCVNLDIAKDKSPAVVYYVLDAPAAPAETPRPPDPRILLVADTTTTAFYDRDALVFSRSPGTRGQYQFARWTERPGKRFADLLRARLQPQFAATTAGGGYVQGDLLLDTELTEFYHDADTEPGSVRVVLRAELIDLKQRKLLAQQTFEQRVALTRYDAAAAAQGFNQATAALLDATAAWLAAQKSPAQP